MKILMSVFVITLVLFSFFTYAFVDANISYLSNLYTGYYFSHRTLLVLVYTILIGVLFGCFYFYTQHQIGAGQAKNSVKHKFNLNRIITLTILASLIAYPAALTFDIFSYMTTAKVFFLYQENPYIIYPIEFVNEPYLEFTRAANKTALYGPFWILLTGIPYFVGIGNFVLTLFSFKAFIALFYIGTVYLISKIDKNAVVFFALNPLVVIETLVSSHNDVVMIFFALLAFYTVGKNKILSIASVLGSIMIKFATVFLLPLYLIFFLRKIKDKYRYAAISMFVIFLLSPIREELYPWYAIWFLPFTALLYKNRFLQDLVFFFSFGLMLRYIPYIATGNYFGSTPILRNVFMLTPVLIFLIYSWIRFVTRKNA